MNRAKMLTISPSDVHRLTTLSLACRALEHLLITQDADMRGTLNPMELSAMVNVLAVGIEQAIDDCGEALITHPGRRKTSRKTRRANHA